MEEEQFITNLALDILGGLSFNINGRKCDYQGLFAETDENIQEDSQFDSAEEKDDSKDDGSDDDEILQSRDLMPPLSSYPVLEETDLDDMDRVQARLLLNLNQEYDRLLDLHMANAETFQKKRADKGIKITQEDIQGYQEKMRRAVETISKSVLESIQDLQNQFQDVNRLQKVTDTLELLSKAIDFDD